MDWNPPDAWDDRNPFRGHVWWHRALYCLERGDYDQALALYDLSIGAGAGGIATHAHPDHQLTQVVDRRCQQHLARVKKCHVAGDPLNLGAMFGRKLDIVPERVSVPAMEVLELREHTDLSVLFDRGFGQRRVELEPAAEEPLRFDDAERWWRSAS